MPLFFFVTFCCGSALEAQCAGTRAAPNKTREVARFDARDVQRLMRGGGMEEGVEGGGWQRAGGDGRHSRCAAGAALRAPAAGG